MLPLLSSDSLKESATLLSLKKEKELSFTAVLAQSLNGVIGKEGKLPWHEPADMKSFMETTMGGWLLMGRRTWEGFEGKSLKGRKNLILSRNPKLPLPPGLFLAEDLEQAIHLIPKRQEVFIIGGSGIYKTCFPFLDEIYLTLIKILCEGDVYFNAFDFIKAEQWEITENRILSPRAELFKMKVRP